MAWVTKNSTETYNQTPEPPREYTKKEKAANWWHYHWMAVVVAVLVVVFGVWIIKDTVFRTRPDVQVAYVGTSDLPIDMLSGEIPSICDDALDLKSVERNHIIKVLHHTHGNKTETARLLKIGLTTLYRKIEEYGIRV